MDSSSHCVLCNPGLIIKGVCYSLSHSQTWTGRDSSFLPFYSCIHTDISHVSLNSTFDANTSIYTNITKRRIGCPFIPSYEGGSQQVRYAHSRLPWSSHIRIPLWVTTQLTPMVRLDVGRLHCCVNHGCRLLYRLPRTPYCQAATWHGPFAVFSKPVCQDEAERKPHGTRQSRA